MKIKIILFLSIIIQSLVYGDIPTIGIPKPTEKIFVGVVENRQKQLERMIQERDRLQKERQEEDPQLR
jgi:hypothetical protein